VGADLPFVRVDRVDASARPQELHDAADDGGRAPAVAADLDHRRLLGKLRERSCDGAQLAACGAEPGHDATAAHIYAMYPCERALDPLSGDSLVAALRAVAAARAP
jgi:hypothetical protein